MNQIRTRKDRLDFLLSEQARVRRSRIRRRNTGFAAAMLLLVGGVAWMLAPSQHPVQPNRLPQQATTATHSTPESDQAATLAPESKAFRITRVEDRSLRLTTVVQNTEPKQVEYISDLQLFIAMRSQGIDAGLMRTGGQTQLAFNDEESRRRFEEQSGSPE